MKHVLERLQEFCEKFLEVNPRTVHNKEYNPRFFFTEGFPAQGAHDFMRESEPEKTPVMLLDPMPSYEDINSYRAERKYYTLYFAARKEDLDSDEATAKATIEAEKLRDEFKATILPLFDEESMWHDAVCTVNNQSSFPFHDGWVCVSLLVGVIEPFDLCQGVEMDT